MSNWIPITEKLPDKGTTVLVCDEKGIINVLHGVTCAGWEDDGGWWISDIIDNESRIVAWMPLPEPYEGNTYDT